MRTSNLLAALSLLFAFALLPSLAAAQTLTIGSAEVRRGGTAIIPVQFVPGEVGVVGFQTVIIYDPTLFNEPTCQELSALICSHNHDIGRVVVLHWSHLLNPLAQQTFAQIRFQFRSTVPRGTRAVLGAYATEFYDEEAERVPFTVYTGRIDLR